MSAVKILIADPSKTMRTIVRRTLRHAGLRGFTILEAANGPDAIRSVFRHRPELVLSEWHLPEQDGLQCLAQTREAGIPTKFGFVTSSATALFRRRARDAGAYFVMSKPFTTEMFEHLLAPLLLNGEADVPTELAPATLHDTLVTLSGKPCRVEPVQYWNGEDAAVAAAYCDEEGVRGGALFAEAGFACGVAAATNMASPALAVHGLRKNMVPRALRDCVKELTKILGGLLNSGRGRHLVLDQLWLEDDLPASVASLLARRTHVVTYEVTIAGYVGGRLTLANELP